MFKMKTKVVLFIGLLCLFACNKNDSSLPSSNDLPALIPRQDIKLSAVEQELSVQTNNFAFNLLKTVYANEQAQKNLLLSPLSASFVFLMLNNGAAGNTQEEIQQTLGYDGVSRDVINVYAQKLVGAMQKLDSRTTIESANSIWIQKDFQVFDAFKQVNLKYFEADTKIVDFKEQASLNQINGWVNEKTNGKIPTILNDLPDPLTRMMLMNAIYFKGYWKEPFDKKLTTNAVFRTSAGAEQTVPTMMQDGISRYTKVGNSSAVELPFGNEAFSLVVVLPGEDTPISTVVEQIDNDWWERITDFNKTAGEMAAQKRAYCVHLELPRFKLEYERSLAGDLKALGMQTPFDLEAADFSLISKDELFVSEVKQKAFAQMDENGVEAAAVTFNVLLTSPGYELVPVDFKANRPFLFFIKEKSTNLVLFTGVMNKID
jgi:serpin B